MTVTPEAAAELDGVIDRILAEDRGPTPGTPGGDWADSVRVLRDLLPRFHPRFGFEDRLSDRLIRAGSALDAGRSSLEPIPFPAPAPGEVAAEPSRERRRRSMLAGGAIASGVSIALPLAGAAFVVWRRSRSSGGLW